MAAMLVNASRTVKWNLLVLPPGEGKSFVMLIAGMVLSKSLKIRDVFIYTTEEFLRAQL